MSSNKIIDIFNTLTFISDGVTTGNNKLTIDSGGILTLFNTTSSQYSSIGALVIQNGGLSINNLVNATSVSNGGALTVAGGAAISGDLIIGGSIYYSNAAAASSTFAYLTLTATDQSISIANGALVVFGGISIQSTKDATSTTSGGGMTIAGGLGVNSSLYVGGNSNLTNIIGLNITTGNIIGINSFYTNTTIGVLNVTGITAQNINFTGSLYQNGSLYISSQFTTFGSNIAYTTGNVGINTTSPTFKLDVNGSLRVSGTSGTLNLISSNTTTDILQIQNTNISGSSTLQFLNSSGGNKASFGIGNANSTSFQNTAYFSAAIGVPINLVAGNNTNNPFILNAADNSISITTTTNAVDTSSGSLKVSGGASFRGDVYIGGALNVNSPYTVNINNSTASSNSTTGAMKLIGGLSISVIDTTNSNSTSYTSGGGITVRGGLAVSQDTYIGGILDIQGGSNNMNPVKIQSLQISSNFNNGSSTVIQSGNSSRTSLSFVPIAFSGLNDQTNPKMVINTNTIDITNSLNAKNNSNTLANLFTSNGNVGINVVNPSNLFEVLNGRITARGNSTTNVAIFQGIYEGTVNTQGTYLFGFSDNKSYLYNMNIAGTNGNSSLILQATSTNTQLGNVGIGTNTPNYTLDIAGSVNISGTTLNMNGTTPYILYNQSGVNPPTFSTRSIGTKISLYPSISSTTLEYAIGIENVSMWFSTFQNFKWYANSTTPSMVINGQNVGIGTTSPSYQLDVRSTSNDAIINLQSTNSQIRLYSSNASNIQYIQSSGDINFTAIGSTSVRTLYLATSGNVGIGNTNPGFTLDVTGNARISSSLTTASLNSVNVSTTNFTTSNSNVTNSSIASLNSVNVSTTNFTTSNSNVTNSSIASLNTTKLTTNSLYISGPPINNSIELNITNLSYTSANIRLGIPNAAGIIISNALIGAAILTNDFGPIQIGTGNTGLSSARMTFDTSGNVGINTNTPTVTLDVNGIINAFDSSSKTYFGGIATEVSAQIIDFGMNDTRFGGQTSTAQGGFFRVDTRTGYPPIQIVVRPAGTSASGNPAVSINTSGNVGIGITTPIYTLDVSGNARISSNLTTGSLFSSNSTITNMVSSNFSTSNILATNINISGNITVGGNLTVLGTLTSVNVTSVNIIDNNITTSSILITGGSLNATFTTNTLANLFTIGGNIGINVVNPSNLLEIFNGRITVRNNNTSSVIQSFFESTTVTQGTFLFTQNDNKSYLYNSNIIGGTNNSLILQATSTNTQLGNVGIGTNTPNYTLDIAGSVNISGTTLNMNGTTPYILYNQSGVNPPTFSTRSIGSKIVLYPSTSSTTIDYAIGIENVSMWFSTFQNFKWYVNSTTPSMTINGQNVGIGTTSPSSQLDIKSTSTDAIINLQSTNSQIKLFSTNASNIQYIQSSGDINFTAIGSNSVRTLYLATSGNVGIGNGNPSYTLDVTGISRITTSLTTGAVYSTNATITNAYVVNLSMGSLNISTLTLNSLIITGGSLNATFNSNTIANLYMTGGNIGINNTTPFSMLHIIKNGAPTTSGNVNSALTISNNNNGSSISMGINDITVSNGNYGWIQSQYVNNANQIQLLVLNPLGGNVGINTTSPQFTLDIAGSIGISGSAVNLNNTTNNVILYNASGVNQPTLSTRSIGTKVVLYPNINSNSFDYAIGIENSILWNSAVSGFKWYTNANTLANMILTANVLQLNSITYNCSYNISQSSGKYFDLALAAGAGSYSTSAISGDTVLRTGTGQNLLLQTTGGGAVNVIIASSGNVGIGGIVSPINTLSVQSISDIPAINPDAFNSLIISEDMQQSTLRSGITQGNSFVYSQYTGGTTGYIQFTGLTTGNYGQYYWNINPGNSFTTIFDHLAGGGTGADEIGFYFYGTAAPSSTSTYASASNGYILVFTEYTSAITLYYNGVSLVSVSVTDLGSNLWHTSTITFFRNNIRVMYDGRLVINYLDTVNRDITTSKSFMGFNAYSGAVTNFHRIRNIRIQKFTEGLFQFINPTSANILNVAGGNIFTGNFTNANPTRFTTIIDNPKLVISTGVNGFPATIGTVGNAIGLRIRGSDDGVFDMGINSGSGAWLQSTNYQGYNLSYPLLLNPNGGNVGIANNSPGTYLTVGPNGGVTGSGNIPGISMKSVSGLQSHFSVGQTDSNNVFLKYQYNVTVGNGYGSLSTYSGSNPLVLQDGAGFVGINSTSPSNLLEVLNGRISIRNNSGSAVFQTLYESTSVSQATFLFTSSDKKSYIYNNNIVGGTNNALVLQTNEANGILGNVGIGTNTPNYTLDIAGSVNISGTTLNMNGTTPYILYNQSGIQTPTFSTRSLGTKIVLYPGSTSTIMEYAIGIESNSMWFSTFQNFKWYANSTTPSMVINGQNVGIGTTSPSSQLDIRSTSSDAIINLQSTNSQIKLYSTNASNIQYIQSSGDINFTGIGSNSVRTLYLATSGNVGIGNGNPSYPLDIIGNFNLASGGTYGIRMANTGNAGGFKVGWNLTGGGGESDFYNLIGGGTPGGFFFKNQNTSGSDIGFGPITASAFNTSSDSRIKKNVIDIVDALNIISNIKPITYNLIDERGHTEKMYGVIAQDLNKYLPDAITISNSFIPDIYKLCNFEIITREENTINVAGAENIIEDSMEKLYMYSVTCINHKLIIGDIVKICLIHENEELSGDFNITIVEISNDIFNFNLNQKIEDKQIFIYGKKVDDFMHVEYNDINMINVAATKELLQIINIQRDEINNLKSDMILIKQILNL